VSARDADIRQDCGWANVGSLFVSVLALMMPEALSVRTKIVSACAKREYRNVGFLNQQDAAWLPTSVSMWKIAREEGN
jgi:hypothetical protein